MATTTITVCDRCKREVKGGKTWRVQVTISQNAGGISEGQAFFDKGELPKEQLLDVKELGACCLNLLRDRIKDFSSRYRPRRRKPKPAAVDSSPLPPAGLGAVGEGKEEDDARR